VLDRIWQNWGLWAAHRKLPSLWNACSDAAGSLHGANDLETQLEPIFVYFKQSRQPESFGSFAIALVSRREFAAKYESQTAAAAEITDDSGSSGAIADSTTTEITDDSNGREVAIANTTTLKDVAGSAFG